MELIHLGKIDHNQTQVTTYLILAGGVFFMERIMTMPTIDMQSTGQNIITMRKAVGMTVKDLQDIFGFSTPQAIYKWQQGVAMPTIDNLVVLAKIFQTTIDNIIVIKNGSKV